MLLRYGYSLAMRWQVGGVTKNPMDGVKPLKVDNKIERYLSDADMARLVAAVRSSPNPMLQHIVGYLIFTGARKREVLDARWADIDFATKLWRIPKTKAGKPRHVPLSGEALALLAQVQQLHQKHFGLGNPYIFPNLDTGKPFRSVFYSWHTARTQAGLPEFRMHDLRHSFASFLVNAGRSLYEVQLLLGHADIRTTSRYAHLDQKRLFDAVEVIKGVD